MTDEAMRRQDIEEDELQEIRLKFTGLCNLTDNADLFFRHPIGIMLVISLSMSCTNLYRMISWPACRMDEGWRAVRSIVLLGGALIPTAYLHHYVSIIILS